MRRPFFPLLALLIVSAPAAAQQPDSLISAGNHWLSVFGETDNLADARRAHAAFSAILRRDRLHAAAHFGLGRAYALVERRQLDQLGFNDATRITNNSMAIRHLISALENGADPSSVLPVLTMVVVRELKSGQLEEISEAIDKVAALDENARIAVAQFYLITLAEKRAATLLKGATSEHARRLLGVAQLLDSTTAAIGAATYLSALADADSALLSKFMLDARWLADPQEAAEWDELDPIALKQRLRSFWDRRAVRSAVTLPERLGTHFERVQEARHRFNFYRQRKTRGALPSHAIDVGIDNRVFNVDDRAFVFVRYGEPDDMIRTAGDGLWNESWVYNRLAAHPVTFDFFLMKAESHGWTLTYDVVSCEPDVGGLPYNENYVRDRVKIDTRYAEMMQRCTTTILRQPTPADVRALMGQWKRERREFLTHAIVRDNAVPETEKNLELMTDVVQFRGEANRSDVTAVVALRLSQFEPVVVGSVHHYRMALSFFVADTLSGTTSRTDSTLAVAVPRTAVDAVARVHLTIQAPPSPNALYRISARDLNAEAVVTVVGDTIDVRQHSEQIGLSDIALASARDGGTWARRGRQLSLLPRGVAPSAFKLFYEIYNVEPGADYQTQVTFTPQDEALEKLLSQLKGSRSVSFTFSGSNETNQRTVAELQTMTTELPAGSYTMEVAVTLAGSTAKRQRSIRIP